MEWTNEIAQPRYRRKFHGKNQYNCGKKKDIFSSSLVNYSQNAQVS